AEYLSRSGRRLWHLARSMGRHNDVSALSRNAFIRGFRGPGLNVIRSGPREQFEGDRTDEGADQQPGRSRRVTNVTRYAATSNVAGFAFAFGTPRNGNWACRSLCGSRPWGAAAPWLSHAARS